MIKQTIEVEGLPEGWKVIAYREPMTGEPYLHQGIICSAFIDEGYPYLIVEKIQPRRIVLEETNDKSNPHEWQRFTIGTSPMFIECDKVLREVTETEDPKLSLSVG